MRTLLRSLLDAETGLRSEVSLNVVQAVGAGGSLVSQLECRAVLLLQLPPELLDVDAVLRGGTCAGNRRSPLNDVSRLRRVQSFGRRRLVLAVRVAAVRRHCVEHVHCVKDTYGLRARDFRRVPEQKVRFSAYKTRNCTVL